MNVTLQRHCARYIYVVPEGLRELMSDISREVLRSQPTDIYTFIADYLDALMITRENARVAAKFVQYLSDSAETVVDLLDRTGMNRHDADKFATIIQHAFKSYSEKKGILKEDDDKFISRILEDVEIPLEQAEAAVTVIQNAFRAYKTRKQREKELLSDIIDWRIAARSAIKLYRKTGVSHEEAKRAATLIKAAYKGYYTRRNLEKLSHINASIEEEMLETQLDEGVRASGASILTITSTASEGARKSKSVRIDLNSIIPHVDFGEPVVIGHEEVKEEVKEEPAEEVKEEKHIASEISRDFIRGLLMETVLSPIGEEEVLEELEAVEAPLEEAGGDELPLVKDSVQIAVEEQIVSEEVAAEPASPPSEVIVEIEPQDPDAIPVEVVEEPIVEKHEEPLGETDGGATSDFTESEYDTTTDTTAEN